MAVLMGVFFFAVGVKGKRFVLLNSEIMIYQLFGGVCGQVIDIKIYVEWILKIKNRINKILLERIG